MTSEDHGTAGPYTEYDNLPVLHAGEKDLPLLHPYGTVEVGGRYVTPGGGRLTVRRMASTSRSHWTTLVARPSSPQRRPPSSSGSVSLLRTLPARRVPSPRRCRGGGAALLRTTNRQHRAHHLRSGRTRH
ncbi:MAG TPA: DUF6420 family protein [Streptomyces sp.]|nr:DUF6420 family protein [Streptomyces sp.]HWU10698.1 DUF6420 family protein [Streptomyces sp.]